MSPKLEQITDERDPRSLIQTIRGDITWAQWLREQKAILDAGSWYQRGTVSVHPHGMGKIALWGVRVRENAS